MEAQWLEESSLEMQWSETTSLEGQSSSAQLLEVVASLEMQSLDQLANLEHSHWRRWN